MLCSYVYEGMYLHFAKVQRDIYSAFDVITSVSVTLTFTNNFLLLW